MGYECIRFSIDAGIARITLNRPERLNSFNEAMHAELRAALATIKQDAGLRVLVITGAGRGFCAGQDLADRAVTTGEQPRDLSASIERNYKPLILALRALEVPVVCAVNGVAAGAGVSLALACDLVLAAKSASFILAFSRIGLTLDCGASYFLPRLVGSARAMGLALLGERLAAEQAAQWGLIWRCVEDDQLSAETDKLAAHFASAPTKALARTKKAIHAAYEHTLADQISLEGGFQAELGHTRDYAEGVNAFLEKRPARFVGN